VTEIVESCRPTFRLRTLMLFITCIALCFWGCRAYVRWVGTPRVSDREVIDFLRSAVPLGTSRKEVEKWLKGRRYESPRNVHDGLGREAIECWISNTGLPLALIPDDIRIQFVFGGDDRLVDVTAITEPRFRF
jgi:hypothetical protein